ncbi:Bifunctional ligase/repressor BirA [Posidoniimonas polymericola]|uniref:biotin--[biotin carboxyl-carrier protein] ligase n=1 Tax=Posidoniimonas polymericola TaxID=2528002 RepID=A0A5C5YQG0_9BACT|nr:biotin--[acetyl-CoA-carboxylase] ligase [Posidoniimonas polymericola]TWT77202.1 Bifunctional ligase/repressor BirA [Posidoniimonas polymericola]
MSNASDNTIDIRRLIDEAPVHHVHYLPETDSTNEVALHRAGEVAADQSELVLTSRQLRGKGRGENRWHAGEGALTFSLITPRLSLPREQTPRISLTAGLAMCHAVEQFVGGGHPQLKWPNDVFLNGRKAAGILIESPGDSVDRFVIGIGLNVNNPLTDAPAEVRDLATSLSEAAGQSLPLTDVLIACLQQLDACLKLLLAGSEELARGWRSASLLDGRKVRLALPTEAIEGVCRGIGDDGALLIETPSGERACYGGVVERFE